MRHAPTDRIETGDVAPRFEFPALSGKLVYQPDAEDWTLISFLRYASCPMCNLRVRELDNRREELALNGVNWLAVFHSPTRRLARYAPSNAAPHIIADPARRLYDLYGVGHSWTGLLKSILLPSFYVRFLQATMLGYWGGAIDESIHSMPADFVISPDGLIRHAHYGTHMGDHLPVDSILDIKAKQNSVPRFPAAL